PTDCRVPGAGGGYSRAGGSLVLAQRGAGLVGSPSGRGLSGCADTGDRGDRLPFPGLLPRRDVADQTGHAARLAQVDRQVVREGGAAPGGRNQYGAHREAGQLSSSASSASFSPRTFSNICSGSGTSSPLRSSPATSSTTCPWCSITVRSPTSSAWRMLWVTIKVVRFVSSTI